MDEEQPQKKITLNNFFEQIVEVNKVANAALTNSNNLRSQLNAVQLDLKRLVESLQVNFDSGVQNVQTQINEVTNVIVDDQRIKQSETDALEQQIFAQEDQLQKQVRGQKVKTTSSDGNLIQRATSSVQNKAKSNLLAAGLFGSSFLLAGIKGKRQESDYKKNRKRSRPKVKSDGNFFTNFFKRDDSKGDNKEKVIEKKNEEVVKKIEKKITPTNITNNIVNNNVVKEIIEEKKPDLVASNVVKEIIEEKKPDLVASNVEFNENEEVKEFNKERKQIKNLLRYNPLDVVKASIKSYNEGGTGIAGFNEETGKIEVTTKEELEAHKKAVLSTKAGVQPDGGYSTYAANTPYSEFMGFDGGEVKDGGTTVIEGGTEVVNENMDSGQKRGEVVVDTEIVKSSNSPVASIAIAEGNSLNNLVI